MSPPEQPTEQAADEPSDRLYTPEPGELQLTFRAVFVGCLLGGLVTCMNVYFGLKTGWSLGGSLIAAILGFSVFRVLRPKEAFTRLETNIAQTAGSAAGSMTSAAGLLAAIPAMGMLGYDFAWWQLMLWALAVAYLGVFFAVPLRRQMVLQEKLRFPTGTATAETVMAMYSEGSDAIDKARKLLLWAGAAAGFTLLVYFLPSVGHPEISWGFFGIAAGWGFSLLISPLMTGAGILIGPRVGASLLAGAIASWAILGPFAQSQGWAPGPIMAYADGPRGWLLWPGVAIMVADALTSLALSWRTILNTFMSFTKKQGDVQDAAEGIPNTWWIGGLLVASAATTGIAYVVFGIPPHFSIIAIALSSILAMIAVRSTGETDINPIGGMGKVTQLVYGAIAPGAIATNLMAAAITGAGASQAGDMMQDLKTGHLLGASPRKQFLAQLVGIAAGVIFCIPIYKLFDTVHDIGDLEGDFPAPAAHAWKAMAELLSQGFDALPPMATYAVAGGLAFGALMSVLNKHGPKVIRPYLPSGLAFGIAFIVPAYYAVAMFLGSLVLVIWQKTSASSAKKLSFAVASGLVAGEGLMGVVTSIADFIRGLMG
jgi:uncharacterized oligopeptide transporter (OPT) family protein